MKKVTEQYTLNALERQVGELGLGEHKTITGMLWADGKPFELFSLVVDVEFEGSRYRCLSVTKWFFDEDDTDAVDCIDTVLFEAYEL